MTPISKRVPVAAARLHLVAARPDATASGLPPGLRPRSPLALWHLLSLDAPSVAACWTLFAGWCAGVRLAVIDPVAMFLAVWMLYAADRLLDARPLSSGIALPDLEERHLFHHRHRSWLVPAIAVAAIPLAVLTHHLAPPVLHLYALLACLLGGYLLLVHAQPGPSAGARRLPKEFAVGLFFPAAVFIPTVARAPALRPALLPGALLFAAVCVLNCLFLYAWEHPHDRSRAHITTRISLQLLVPAARFLACGAAVVALLGFGGWPPLHGLSHPACLALAAGTSAVLLLILHRVRANVPALRLRALADLVLLTPLAILLLFTARHLR